MPPKKKICRRPETSENQDSKINEISEDTVERNEQTSIKHERATTVSETSTSDVFQKDFKGAEPTQVSVSERDSSINVKEELEVRYR
jgi:hypothetical protein